MLTFLTETTAGKLIATFFISMIPMVELRGGLPYGVVLDLPYPLALAAAVLGNMAPVPFIIVYIRRVFEWLRKHFAKLDGLLRRLEKKAHVKGRLVRKYSAVGLCLLVAVPLPGTGAWTGALVAAMLNMRLKKAVPTIFLGACIAAGIMTAVTFGVIRRTSPSGASPLESIPPLSASTFLSAGKPGAGPQGLCQHDQISGAAA